MESTVLPTTGLPSAGFPVDVSSIPNQPSAFSLAGVQFEDVRKTSLTENLTLKFERVRFQGNELASGIAGSEPAIIEARNGRIEKAQFAGTRPVQLGDIAFENFRANLILATNSIHWFFTGPGKYFQKPVNVGTPGTGNPQVKIGGDPLAGFQLQVIEKSVRRFCRASHFLRPSKLPASDLKRLP